MQGLMNIFMILFTMGFALIITAGLATPFVILYCFLTFVGSKKREEKAQEKLSTILMQGESVVEQSLQLRVFALFSRRILLAITNSRIIFIRRGLFGGFTMQDIQWKDLRDVKVSENIMPNLSGSNLNFYYCIDDEVNKQNGDNEEPVKINNSLLSINGISSDKALKIYSKAQAEEQEWIEKRRIRNIEEMRASAGGVVVNGGHGQISGQSTEATTSISDEIGKAKKLLDDGTISDSEFHEMKSKILSKNY